MVSSIVKLMRIASFLICMIVILSFGAFVLEKTTSASNHQQALVGGEETTSSGSHPSSVHRWLDEASTELTSPFAGVVSGTHSEWASRGGKLVLALIIYGFGLGYLARVVRVRV